MAFANTKGGHILFGVTDNGHDPIGLDDAQSTASKISELLTSRVGLKSRTTGMLHVDTFQQ
ncbi:ATP-binding protein [Mordavella massiliensis]|uniref:ATP-binding protein n=1 Tax=Mordavella massiliensis TaxID=1871024 RepID=A0A938X4I1_9CLOT|nr:ATP-binding protein [Mordavella massiliensis]